MERLKVIGKDAARRSDFVLFHFVFCSFNARLRGSVIDEEMCQCTVTT